MVTTVNRLPHRMDLKRDFLFVGCPDYYAFTRQMSSPLGGYTRVLGMLGALGTQGMLGE